MSGWVDEIAAKAPKARKSPVLVGTGEPAISDDIGNQYRRELPGLAHRVPPAGGNIAQLPARERSTLERDIWGL